MTIATTSSAANATRNPQHPQPGVLAKSARTPGYPLVAANAAKGTDKSVCATWQEGIATRQGRHRQECLCHAARRQRQECLCHAARKAQTRVSVPHTLSL